MSAATDRLAGPAVGYVVWAVMAGTTLPNALWGWYQAEWHISSVAVSAAFATYAAAVVASLVLVGSIADSRGPWQSLRLGATLAAAASAVSLVDGLPALFAGRALSGISVGLVSGAAVAALSHLRRGGARTSTIATMLGLATGPLLAGAVVELASSTVRGAYLAHLVAMAPALLLLGLWHTRPSATGPSARPLAVRRDKTFLGAALAGFAANAQLGLYAVLAPAMLAKVLGEDGGVLLGGVAGCVLFAAAGAAQLSATGAAYAARLTWAVAAHMAAIAAVAVALDISSVGLLMTAILLAGLGGGLAFGDGLAVATGAARPDERATVSSTWFVVAYLGLVGPVLGSGALADSAGVATAAVLVSAVAAGLLVTATAIIAHGMRHRQHPHRKEELWTSS